MREIKKKRKARENGTAFEGPRQREGNGCSLRLVAYARQNSVSPDAGSVFPRAIDLGGGQAAKGTERLSAGGAGHALDCQLLRSGLCLFPQHAT